MTLQIRFRGIAASTAATLLVAFSAASSSQNEPANTPASTPPAASQVAPASAPTASPAVQIVPAQAAPDTSSLTPEQLGDTLMARQRYQAAIEAYKKGPRNSGQLWNKMGIAYQLMLNLEEATRCYGRSLKLDPHNSVVLNNLGTVYDSLKQYPNAERMYHKALKYDPTSALIYKNLGTNLLSQHKYKRGWEYYKQALALDPEIFRHSTSPRVENPATVNDRGAMNYYLARGCVRAGMDERAVEYLRLALNEGFTNPKKIMADIEFARLHGMPAFEQLLSEQRTP